MNEQYRLFVCAADLLAENVKDPWQTQSRPPDTEWTAAVDFIKQQNGPHDVQAAFDGRMRACRVLADQHLGNDNQEIFLTYTGELRRACRTRRTVLSASTCEVGLVRLPGDRANWKLKKRGGDHNACGESWTCSTTYSGVVFRSTHELPMITPETKAKIFSRTTTALPEKWTKDRGTAEPLLWMETKPVSFWGSLLDDLNIKAVFDVSPGSGALAVACLGRGLLYHGLCLALSYLAH